MNNLARMGGKERKMNEVQIPTELAIYIPVITTVLQLLKTIPALSKIAKWFPLISVAVGIGVGFVAMPAETELITKLIGGMVLGVAASGLYSGVKSIGGLATNGG